MFRPQVRSRDRYATHRGVPEASAFTSRFVAQGIQFHIEDLLVNGPPWNTRVAVRIHSFIPSTDGGQDQYANRAVLFLETRWGRLVRWEDYEDTERVSAWDESSRAL